MTRHLLGLAAGVLLVAGLGCASDPTESLVGDVASIETSFSVLQVDVADSVLVTADVKDSQGNTSTTQPEVTSLDPTVVSVTLADVPPLPVRRFYVKGLTFGTGRVRVAAGDQADTIVVDTWPATIDISGVPTTLRSRETATVTLTGLDATDNPIAGVTPMTVVTDDATVLAVDQNTGVVTAMNSGFATLTAYGPSNSAGDTVAEGTWGVRVFANVPASAELSGTSFGGFAAGDTAILELVVLDAYGNQNLFEAEVLSATVNSSDNGIATVAATIVDTVIDGLDERHIYVTVTGVSAGVADISGDVTTSEGTFAFGSAPATVLAPVLTLASPTSGPGGTVVIAGVGLAAPGFETLVLVDSGVVGHITTLTSTAITVDMPTMTAGTYDLQVTVGGVPSNVDTWTQTGEYDEAASEPNDNPGEEAPITTSFEFSGTADEDTDFDDLFQFEVDGDDFVLELELIWGDGNDLDALVYPIGAADPGTYAEDLCGPYELASLANPESGVCPLGDAGTYTLEIMHYGTGPTTYTIRGRIRPR
jgi:hypothetical protein